jgi:hypothetical protein
VRAVERAATQATADALLAGGDTEPDVSAGTDAVGVVDHLVELVGREPIGVLVAGLLVDGEHVEPAIGVRVELAHEVSRAEDVGRHHATPPQV